MSVVSSLLKQPWLPRDGYTRCREAINLCQRHLRRLFDPYRPEFHYMRGPGPKWRAKHGDVPVAGVKVRKMPRE